MGMEKFSNKISYDEFKRLMSKFWYSCEREQKKTQKIKNE